MFAPLLACLVLLGGHAAGSQPAAPQTGGPTLSVLDQSAAVDVPGVLRLELVLDGDVLADDAEVTLTVGPRREVAADTDGDTDRDTRSETDGGDDDRPSTVVPVAVTTDADRPGWLSIEVASTGAQADPGRATDTGGNGPAALPLGEPGAYPVTITVETTSGAELRVDTEVVRRPSTDLPRSEPLPVAIVIDVGPDALSIGQGVAMMTAAPDAPVTTVLSFAAVDGAAPTELAALRAALGGRPVVPAPGDGIDPSALATVDAGDLYAAKWIDDIDRLRSLGFVVDDATVVVDGTLTGAGLAVLSELGIDTVIEPSSSASNVAPDRPPLNRIVQPDHAMLVVGATSTISTTTDLPAAVPITADLAAAATTGGDAVVLRGWHELANPAVVLPDVMARLAEQRLAAPVPLGAVLTSRVTAADVPGRTTATTLDVVTDQLHETDSLLASYTTFHVDGDDAPDGLRAELARTLATDLSDTERVAAIAGIESDVRRRLSVVSLPADQSVTLAARNAPIPLAIHNDSNGTRRVQLRFRSDAITVPDQGRLIAIPPGTSSIDVELESHALGTTPLSVTVLSPDGQHVLATTRFQVRSTAVPGLGLVLAAVGLTLLGAWWLVSVRRSRRRRRMARAAEAATRRLSAEQSAPAPRKAAAAEVRGPRRWPTDDVPAWIGGGPATTRIQTTPGADSGTGEWDDHEPTLALLGRQINNDRADDRERVTAGDKL
ncbi:MAG: hypothetical protein AAF467_05830 [Actinomycetota bacterium]